MQSKLLSASSALASASPSHRSKLGPKTATAGANSVKTASGTAATYDTAEKRFKRGQKSGAETGEQLKIREEEHIQEADLAVKIAQKRMVAGLRGFEWEQMRLA